MLVAGALSLLDHILLLVVANLHIVPICIEPFNELLLENALIAFCIAWQHNYQTIVYLIGLAKFRALEKRQFLADRRPVIINIFDDKVSQTDDDFRVHISEPAVYGFA